jgi:arylsulfatase A-like enzyme
VVRRFTENVDVMPTLLDLLGVEDRPLQCDGRSLLPFTQGVDPPSWRTEVVYEYDFRTPWLQRAARRRSDVDVEAWTGMRMADANLSVVRSETGKYVHFPAWPALYFDLAGDPGELGSGVVDDATAPAALDLAQRLLTRRAQYAERTLTGTLLGPDGPLVADDRLR